MYNVGATIASLQILQFCKACVPVGFIHNIVLLCEF